MPDIEEGCQADWKDTDESRIDIIGQNGNDGLAYTADPISNMHDPRSATSSIQAAAVAIAKGEAQADWDDVAAPNNGKRDDLNEALMNQDAHQLNRQMPIPGPDLDIVRDTPAFKKQERYKDESGSDHIDDCAETYTPEEFRGAMKFTIDKYRKRLGKKDAMSLELHKIADYYQRWSEYEKGLEG